MVIATDAPLDARQLHRLRHARRFRARSRTGAVSHDASGDFAIAFSTANRWQHYVTDHVDTVTRFTEDGNAITEIFTAVIEALEESIWNAVVAAETMTGRDGNKLSALPHEHILRLFEAYGRKPS